MLFTSDGSRRSLSLFLKSIGHATVSCYGSDVFWNVVAARVALGMSSDKMSVNLYAPRIEPSVAKILSKLGVVLSDEKSREVANIVASGDPVETITPYTKILRTVRAQPIAIATNATICYHWHPLFGMPNDKITELIQIVGGRWRPFSWELAAQGGCEFLITTDWQTHFSYTMLGGKSFLITGPAWPREIMITCGISQDSVIALRDPMRGLVKCHCSKPILCHDKTSTRKPCWSSFDPSASVFSEMKRI